MKKLTVTLLICYISILQQAAGTNNLNQIKVSGTHKTVDAVQKSDGNEDTNINEIIVNDGKNEGVIHKPHFSNSKFSTVDDAAAENINKVVVNDLYGHKQIETYSYTEKDTNVNEVRIQDHDQKKHWTEAYRQKKSLNQNQPNKRDAANERIQSVIGFRLKRATDSSNLSAQPYDSQSSSSFIDEPKKDRSKAFELMQKLQRKKVSDSSSEDDKCGSFAKYVNRELQKLEPRMAALTEKLINEVVSNGKLSTLTVNSRIVNREELSTTDRTTLTSEVTSITPKTN